MNRMALKDVHDLDLAPVNTLPHGEKIADVFKVGRLSPEPNRITCVFKSRELSPPGVREMRQRGPRDSDS